MKLRNGFVAFVGFAVISTFAWAHLYPQRNDVIEYYTHYKELYSQVETPEMLYSFILQKLAQNDEASLQKLLYPPFPPKDSEYNKQLKHVYYTELKKYDFTQATYTVNMQSNSFEIANALKNEVSIQLNVPFTRSYLDVRSPEKDFYALSISLEWVGEHQSQLN
jgi:hypothetical protein